MVLGDPKALRNIAKHSKSAVAVAGDAGPVATHRFVSILKQGPPLNSGDGSAGALALAVGDVPVQEYLSAL